MNDDNHEPSDKGTQPTQPAKGKPVEIPVPTRDAVLRDLERVSAPKPSKSD